MKQSLPENEALRQWLEQGGQAPDGLDPEFVRAVEQAGELHIPDGHDSVSQAWGKFVDRNDIEETIIRKPNWQKYLAIAATVLVLVSAGFFVLNQKEQTVSQSLQAYNTAPAEHKQLRLPDGSIVTLNASSSVAINEAAWAENRSLELQGEAFFEVTKGSTFTVQTDFGKVTVLGTSFNVYARNEVFKVACMSGSVKVTHVSQDIASDIVLEPGESVSRKQDQEPTVNSSNNLLSDSWRKGEFYFDNAPLNEVIAVMERHFGVQIDLDASTERFYTGFFTNDDIEESFVLVCKPLGMKVDKLSKQHYRISRTAN